VKDRPVLSDIDLFASEHRRDPVTQTTGFGERDQEPQRLAGDPIFCKVKVNPLGFNREPLPSGWVVGEQLTQVDILDLCGVVGERLPFRALGEPS
jgi:hypothetical protein